MQAGKSRPRGLDANRTTAEVRHAQLEDDLVICPLALGGGRTLFGDRTLDLKLAKTETFERGSALLTYKT